MSRVRSKDQALGRLLTASPFAIYAVDDQRRILFCNAACADMLQVTPDDLVGQRCVYRSPSGEATPVEIAASLCPPPDVFAGDPTSVDLNLLCASGELIARGVDFLPLGRDEVQSVGVLGIIFERGPGSATHRVGGSESADLHRRLSKLQREVLCGNPQPELIGVSPAIQRVREQIDLASGSQTRVLVHGPGGSGREHVARLVHRRAAPNQSRQLVPLCCPLLDAELLQTTITALVRQIDGLGQDQSKGISERGDSAPTLLLLEADQLVEEAQAELSGFLSLPDFQLYAVSTAECSLVELAQAGRFRTDLAHALSTLTVQLPSLAERIEDIPLLGQYFLERFNSDNDRQLAGFTSEALDELVGHSWDDNLDELAEITEQACRSAEGPFVQKRDLPDQIRWVATATAHPRREEDSIVLDEFLAEIEKEMIERAMLRAKGNKTKASKMLGLTRARLHRRLDHFGLS